MKRILVALLLVLSFARFGEAADAKDDLQPIFNGKDLTGWKVPADNKWWKVVDGVLVGENDEAKKGSMLYSEKSYGDVVVEAPGEGTDLIGSSVTYTLPANVENLTIGGFGDGTGNELDNVIMLRKPEIQCQIGISRSLKKDMTCSLYAHRGYPEAAQAKGVEKLLKEGDWNKIRFQAVGSKFTAWLNGEKVVEYEDPAFPNPAPIGLQIHPGLKMKVEFRNIKAKEL